MFKWQERRLARQQEARHQAWLEREKDWWNFMLTMDSACGKVTAEEVKDWRTRISNGEEYVGWAMKGHND